MSTNTGLKKDEIAGSIPFDNSSNGFTATTVQEAIEEVKTGGSGVTPPFIFSKSGGAGVGAYLKTGEVLTSNTGQLVKGSNYIVEINVSTSALQTNASGATIQIQRRTGLNTFVDITGATVNIPNGTYKGSNTGLTVAIGPDWELACYNIGPGNMTDPVVTVFMAPQ